MSITKEVTASAMFPQALLGGNGLPTLDLLSNFMCDIDQQLTQQEKKMEDTLEKLVEGTNALSSDNMYTNIKDAMDSLIHTSVMEECACLPPDSEDVNKLLKIITDHIEAHPGSESVVFQQLLYISCHEGMTLPIRAPKLENVASSSLSLNTISDTMEIENDSLWEDVRSRIKKFFLEQLQWTKSDDPCMSLKRVQLLQSMCILYPTQDVWSSYENLRSQQLLRMIGHHLQGSSGGISTCRLDLETLAESLPTLMVALKQLMEEDFYIFMVGVFEQELDLKTALWKIYITKLSDVLQGHLNDIASKKGDQGPMANGHATKFKSVASLADVLSQTSFDENSQLAARFQLTEQEIKHLLSIAKNLAGLNDFYKSLCYQASWDTTLAFKLPVKGKGHLKGVLKHRKDSNNSDVTGPSDYQRRGVLPDAIPPPFGATPGMLSDGDPKKLTSDIVLETPASQKNKWNWFYLLENFLPGLIESFCYQTKDVLMKKLTEEETLWNDCHHLRLSSPSSDPDVANKFAVVRHCLVTESSLYLVSSLNFLTPLEPLWMELPLRYFKSVLNNASRECLQLLFTDINKKVNEYSCHQMLQTGSIKELYILLASVSLVLQWIKEAEPSSKEEDSKHPFGSVQHQFEELRINVMKLIQGCNDHLVQLMILQDAESQNWSDQKPFFEDERCSFSVQMWNLHMERLRQELWTCCPMEQAREMFGSILGNSLQFLSQRYSRAKPSYKRTKQFRCDILFILCSAMEHLFSSVDTIQKVLPFSLSVQAHPASHIHSPCTNLLGPLAVVSSPLADLYKIFKKGYSQRQRFREDKETDPSWLGWIWPDLFERYQSLNEMPDSAAVFLVIKLLKRQKTSFPLLLQAILMRNGLLPCLFAREVGKKNEVEPVNNYDSTQLKFEEFPVPHKTLLHSLANLLAFCTDFPRVLGNFLMTLVEREYTYSGSRVLESVYLNDSPLWMQCVLELLLPSFVRCLQEIANQLQGEAATPCSQPGFLENLRQLPCGCRIRSKGQMLQIRGKHHQYDDDILLDACRQFFLSLALEITSLSISVCVFMQKLEKLLPDQSPVLPLKSVSLKVIVHTLLIFLNDEEKVKGQVGTSVSEIDIKRLCQIGKSVCALVLGRTPDNVEVLPNILKEFRRQHAEWLKDTINMLTEHFQKKEFTQPQDISVEDATQNYQEDYYKMLIQNISFSPKVTSGLAIILDAVSNNVEWIQNIIEIPPVPFLTLPSEASSFKLNGTSCSDDCQPFNPVTHFNRIGDNLFNFDEIAEFPFKWKDFLQSEIGLTRTSFQLLLSHRHDMQEEVYLDDSEKKAVRILRAKYNLERADFV
ncbi:hypothetical protein HOLleu_28094 [Holothuria leucospilota]|uniref:Uncharacterized protein n=1 Tax=Holothuria leucospilota TaxID=206669 RepID=A0A9Q1BLH5_HOLLE|nr:hypothetical protein HOLleu_28094 [Holothuria leucospilota]